MTELEAVCRQTIPVEEAREMVWTRVDTALTSGPALVRKYIGHLGKSRGKGLRAAALLACAEDADGMVQADGVSFAAAIELLHTATLVHDDVIDDADLRRGEPSLQKLYGKRTAVICGDWLLASALRIAAEAQNKEAYLKFTLPDYVGKICFGELSQHVNNRNLELSVYQYLHIIGGKTAALFEAAFYAGAMLTTDDPKRLRRFCRLGRYIGMIFQITDDCIDFEEDRSIALKPVQSDFEQGVITLPLIFTLSKAPTLKERLLQGVSRTELNRLVRENAGLELSRLWAGRYYTKACAALELLNLPQSQHAHLSAILEKAYRGLRGNETV